MNKTDFISRIQPGEEKRLFDKIEEVPHQTSNYRSLARLLHRRKRPEDAVYALKMLLKTLPEEGREDREVRQQLARVYEESGDLSRAVRLLRSLIRRYPEDFVSYERLEMIYKSQGKPLEMVKLLKAVKAGNPQRERAYKRLVSLYKGLEDFRAARSALRSLNSQFGPDFRRLKEMGRLHEKTGNLKQAVIYYRRAVKFQPQDPNLFHSIGLCRRKAGLRKQARKTFRDILKFKPGWYGSLINLAEMDIEDGNFQEAETRLRKLDARWPGNSRVKINRAHILLQLDRPEEALKLCLDGIQATPFYYTDELSLGHTVLAGIYLRRGDEEESRYHGLMAEGFKKGGDSFQAVIRVIDNLIAAADLEMAEKITDKLLGKYPGNSLASVKKAEIRRGQGKLDEAIAFTERAGRESNPRYLKDKVTALKLMSELYREAGEKAKADRSLQLVEELTGSR